jgi:hypothetical protein
MTSLEVLPWYKIAVNESRSSHNDVEEIFKGFDWTDAVDAPEETVTS